MMSGLNRREFTGSSLAAMGAALLGGSAAAGEATRPKLPTVKWGRFEISRLLVGHNPQKSQSHFSKEMDEEMGAWYAADNVHGRELLARCEQFGINTCQMGAVPMESLLKDHYAHGGKMQWIVTFYSAPSKGKDELARVMKMDPKPIGFQHFGGTTDELMKAGKIDQARDTLKMLRDTGLLVGLCSHNHEVIDHAESKGWDLDFYQCCFYPCGYGIQGPDNWEEKYRQAMVKTISQVSKPCLAYKVLGANRHCKSPETVQQALEFAFAHIKPTDCVLLGMWQKYKDQVGENTAFARKILG
ncbi:MAG: hypothetical protein ACYC35_29705 [Pirellulales bacterium]